jgi:hypothetical protein
VDDLTVHAQTPTSEPIADDTLLTHYAALERLEGRYRHELMGDEERGKLEDRIARLRRRLGR